MELYFFQWFTPILGGPVSNVMGPAH